jgi:antitoxin YefM
LTNKFKTRICSCQQKKSSSSELTPLPKFRTVHLYNFNMEAAMTIHAQYTQARANLASLLDEVTEHREVVIIQRRGHEDVAMISADELTGLLETAHLLRSPKNAARLLAALDRVQKGAGLPQTIEELRSEVQFEQTRQ